MPEQIQQFRKLAPVAPCLVQRVFDRLDRAPVRLIRVEQAKHLLVTTKRSATRIATETGFCDLPHMIKVFRVAEGTTPDAFRKARV